MTAAFVALTADSFVHYSAGPYVVFFTPTTCWWCPRAPE